jgi:hypothetical protein
MVILLWERETEKIVILTFFFFFLTRKGSLTIASAIKLIHFPLEKSHNHQEVIVKSDLQIKL